MQYLCYKWYFPCTWCVILIGDEPPIPQIKIDDEKIKDTPVISEKEAINVKDKENEGKSLCLRQIYP